MNHATKSTLVLIISLPKGLFRLTLCKDCNYRFCCDNCSTNLVTFADSKSNNNRNLFCNECQSTYNYPKICPKCGSNNISSLFGGRQNLEELINTNSLKIEEKNLKIDLSNRIFDPQLDYKQYDKIIITHLENLFLGIDYTSLEDGAKSLVELLLNINPKTQICFDLHLQDQTLLDDIDNPISWYQKLLINEQKNRQLYNFPPFYNLILISATEKKSTLAYDKLKACYLELQHFIKVNNLDEVFLQQPYPAKILKRKGMYTYHLLLNFPKNYSNISILQSKIKELKQHYYLQIRVNPKHTI
jgi:primosomal protein N' (replication factor Y) (superfamily II helicase)